VGVGVHVAQTELLGITVVLVTSLFIFTKVRLRRLQVQTEAVEIIAREQDSVRIQGMLLRLKVGQTVLLVEATVLLRILRSEGSEGVVQVDYRPVYKQKVVVVEDT
jgi:hypothetical protein